MRSQSFKRFGPVVWQKVEFFKSNTGDEDRFSRVRYYERPELHVFAYLL